MKVSFFTLALIVNSNDSNDYFPKHIGSYLKNNHIEYSRPNSKLVLYDYKLPRSIYEKGIIYPVEKNPDRHWTLDMDFNYDNKNDFLCFVRNSDGKREAVIFYSSNNGYKHQVLYTGGNDSGKVKMYVRASILRLLIRIYPNEEKSAGNPSVVVHTDSGGFLNYYWDQNSKEFRSSKISN